MTTLEQALTSGHGNERPFNCMVHDDTNASASVNIQKGVWICYACGARGSVGSSIVVDPDWTSFTIEVDDLLDYEQRFYPESWLDQYDINGPGDYWLGRFEPATCRRFRLGYDHVRDAPCYPLRDEQGRVLGIVRRQTGDGPKYVYPKGVAITKHLFEADRGDDYICLVEGAADAMSMWQAGYTAYGCYGSRLTAAQVRLVERLAPRYVVLAFDDDAAGHRARSESSQLLSAVGIPSVDLTWDTNHKDVGEMDRDQLEKIMKQALAH